MNRSPLISTQISFSRWIQLSCLVVQLWIEARRYSLRFSFSLGEYICLAVLSHKLKPVDINSDILLKVDTVMNWTYQWIDPQNKHLRSIYILKKIKLLKVKITLKQDWVAFMSQPYWVEVMVEVELRLILRLRLIWTWGWNEVEMRLSQSLVELELRLSWVVVEISWHWIKEEIWLS